jgi:phage terminase small subunit
MTGKQKLFVKYYVSNGLNATQAAISAGYSKKTAYKIGSENLIKPQIDKAISKTVQSFISETELSTLKILKKLDEVINTDAGDYANIETVITEEEWTDDDGKVYPERTVKKVVFNETKDLNTRVISEISEGQHGIKIKFQDPLKAIDLKGKYLKMWEDGIVIKNESEAQTLTKEQRRERILELSKRYVSD